MVDNDSVLALDRVSDLDQRHRDAAAIYRESANGLRTDEHYLVDDNEVYFEFDHQDLGSYLDVDSRDMYVTGKDIPGGTVSLNTSTAASHVHIFVHNGKPTKNADGKMECPGINKGISLGKEDELRIMELATKLLNKLQTQKNLEQDGVFDEFPVRRALMALLKQGVPSELGVENDDISVKLVFDPVSPKTLQGSGTTHVMSIKGQGFPCAQAEMRFSENSALPMAPVVGEGEEAVRLTRYERAQLSRHALVTLAEGFDIEMPELDRIKGIRDTVLLGVKEIL